MRGCVARRHDPVPVSAWSPRLGAVVDRAAGRVSDADRERVRDANRIEAVVGDYVALGRAGSGNLKGLCPFHDEKTPSFTVSTARGFYHCFGCGEGGDVFDFQMKIDQLTFVEAIQKLAERAGITVTLSAGADGAARGDRVSRSRLTAITRTTADFFAARLTDPEAEAARGYLTDRGFDAVAAAHFGCGFAPGGWDTLLKHLLAQGFSVDDMVAAGVVRRGQRGPIDQFHRRLTWAIRDAAGDVVGFGARRIFADDKIEAKYVNTSGDGRLYRKSQVLYGLDLAKRDIVRQRQVVVVEGYTDVMAMHLAGVTTAVAACGTAFGEEHIGVLRRYLLDSEFVRGEVIYVFDGDAAGQQAARKAFDSDQKFAAHTFVAVAPGGMDPCELRQQRGDQAVADLVRSRKPLFRFAIGRTLDEFDLDTVEGRTAALTAATPLVARIKEPTARAGYVRELSERVGVDAREIDRRVRSERSSATQRPAARRAPDRPTSGRPGAGDSAEPGGAVRAADHGTSAVDARQAGSGQTGRPPGGEAAAPSYPVGRRNAADAVDPTAVVERETIKLVLQCPSLVATGYDQVDADSFTDRHYAAIHAAVLAAGGPGAAMGATWLGSVSENLPAGSLRSLVTELAVEPVQYTGVEVEPRYAGAILARMAERRAVAQERELASALRRSEAVGDKERAIALRTDLVQMQAYRRALADRARGAEG